MEHFTLSHKVLKGNPPKCHERNLFSRDTLMGTSIEIISISILTRNIFSDHGS